MGRARAPVRLLHAFVTPLALALALVPRGACGDELSARADRALADATERITAGRDDEAAELLARAAVQAPPKDRAALVALELQCRARLRDADGGRLAEDAARAVLDALGPRRDVLEALGDWHRQRPRRAGEDAVAGLVAAEEAYTGALALEPEGADAARILEWRGHVRSRRGAHAAADGDLRRARALHEALGDTAGATRCVRRLAWNEFLAGQLGAAAALLEQHRRLLGSPEGVAERAELRDDRRLLTLIAARRGDLVGAETAFREQEALDEELSVNMPIQDLFNWSAHAEAAQGDLLGALADLAEAHPECAADAFALAAKTVEHARARALRFALLRAAGRDAVAKATLPALPDGVAELRYALARREGDDRDHAVLLARYRDERRIEWLGDAENLEAEVQEFLATWLEPPALDAPAAAYATAARALTGHLLGGALGFWRGADPPRRLLVLAAGPLELLPFEALLVAPGGERYADLPYLVRTTAVVRAPSFAVLAALPRPLAEGRVVALLDPKLPPDEAQGLRFAAAEAAALRVAHDDVVLLEGEDATPRRLREALAERPAAWLHLGCHARPESGARARIGGGRAVLQLAPGGEEGALGLVELLDPRTALPLAPGVRVVLSACGTAAGMRVQGEGVLGLWRAFLHGGASCVVSTLRPVDDRTTAAWMASFHRAARDLPLAEAVRAACLDWIEGRSRPKFPRGANIGDPAHPALWAFAVCTGDDGGPLPR